MKYMRKVSLYTQGTKTFKTSDVDLKDLYMLSEMEDE